MAERVQAIETEDGWGWPSNAMACHYFRGSRSLCGRWAYAGREAVWRNDHPDNCRRCMKALKGEGE